MFDSKTWQRLIRRPDWYLDYVALAAKAKQEYGEDSEDLHTFNRQIRHWFEQELLNKEVNLASEGPDFDAEREPIDTLVIHHTSASPGYRLSYMNAVQLLNIYANYYASPANGDKGLRGHPIWSNHRRDGQPSFLVYHWLMRMDGSFERLLNDGQVGWQAGNWDINKRSIGICLDNDYEKVDPSPEILDKLAEFIKKHYPQVKNERIVGHGEVRNGHTLCPGANWHDVWKRQLLELVNA